MPWGGSQRRPSAAACPPNIRKEARTDAEAGGGPPGPSRPPQRPLISGGCPGSSHRCKQRRPRWFPSPHLTQISCPGTTTRARGVSAEPRVRRGREELGGQISPVAPLRGFGKGWRAGSEHRPSWGAAPRPTRARTPCPDPSSSSSQTPSLRQPTETFPKRPTCSHQHPSEGHPGHCRPSERRPAPPRDPSPFCPPRF